MKLKLFTTIFLSLAVILSACGPTSPTPLDSLPITPGPLGESATETSLPQSTTTPTITDTTIPSLTPTGTTNPTVQPAAQVIPTLNAYCRKGPGTMYYMVTFLQKGSAYDVVGRDSLNSWWLVKAPGVDPCWVGGFNMRPNGPVEQALIVHGKPLLEKPALFVHSYVCNTTLNTLGVLFNWAVAPAATGYRIYRDGELLTTVAGNLSSYHDDAPMEVDLLYELEAFNDYGVAVRVEARVPACR